MKLPFKGTFRQTQGFGENPASYAKFGLKGHNGLDHAVPSGTDLYAMISGTVIEAQLDATGYGNYVKIENDTEGALVGHLSILSVKPGDKVTEGETYIGKSGNTGNSTGPHTHTGYFIKPRNRANGYSGYIDFSHLLTPMETIPVETVVFEKLVANSSKYDEFVKLGYETADRLKEDLTENAQTMKELVAEKEELAEEIGKRDTQVLNLETEKAELTDRINSQSEKLADQNNQLQKLEILLQCVPDKDKPTPTLSNVINLFRLWLKGWIHG